MVEDFNTIRSILKQYIDTIKSKGIKIEKLYLFGSYARGTADENSDIDIALISKHFKGDRFEDRRLLVPLRRKVDVRIEPIPYRPEDFKANDPLVIEIMQNGIELPLVWQNN